MNGVATQADILTAEKYLNFDNLPESTYDMICQGALINPKAPALSFFLQANEHKKLETWSYSQLLGRITQTANFFHALGATKNTVIAYILPNLPETHFVLWGAQATGIVLAINPLLESLAIAELLREAGASIIVTLAPFPKTDLWQKIHTILPDVPSLKHVVLINLANRVTGMKGVFAHLLQKHEQYKLYGAKKLQASVPNGIKIHDYNRKIWLYTSSRLRSKRKINRNDYSSYFCTGGTTGTPKIAMRTHGNEVANAWGAAQFMGASISQGKSVFCGLPLFHVNGTLVTGLLPFSKGAHVILGTPQGYRGENVIKKFWEIVEHHRINFFSGVPTLYSTLLQTPTAGHDLKTLEYGLCGAAPLPIEVAKSFQEKTGLKILEGYGLTEGTCVSSVNPPLGKPKHGSIGLRIPGQAMKVVQIDNDGKYIRDCAIDEVGILLISGPNVFKGYKLAEQNKSIWIDTGDGKNWLNTGDLGRQDIEGYFYLTGRKKELIIRGGHNIDPLAIEGPILHHPAVALAAAIARPDIHAGELPVVYVQLKDGKSITENELLLFAKKNIKERAAIPKHVYIIDQMPLTAIGKIYKVPLKHQEILKELKQSLSESNIYIDDLNIIEDPQKGTVIAGSVENNEVKVLTQKILGSYSYEVDIKING